MTDLYQRDGLPEPKMNKSTASLPGVTNIEARKWIRYSYRHLRTNTSDIPDVVLDFILASTLNALDKLNSE